MEKKRVKRESVSLRLSERERDIALLASNYLGMSFAEFCRMAITQQSTNTISKFKKNETTS